MAKQKKKRSKGAGIKRKPPLSFTDKLIYSLLFVAGAAAITGLYALYGEIIRKIAFSDSSVVAFSVDFTVVFALAFFVYLVISLSVGIIVLLGKPLFKNKNINYNDSKWQRVYPLFDKTRPRPEKREEDKKIDRKIFFCWLGGFLLTFIISLLALCGRYTVNDDFLVQKYTVFNNISETYVSRDFDSVEFDLSYWSGRYGTERGFTLTAFVEMNNSKTVEFGSREFRTDDMGEVFEFFLRLKELFPDEKVTYNTSRSVEEAAAWWNLTEDEILLLRELTEE